MNRFRLLLIMAICSELGGCATRPHIADQEKKATSQPKNPLRVATYNIFVGTRDLNKTAQVVRKLNADILVFQEVSPRSGPILDHELTKDYRYRHLEGGLGVVSRYPIRKVRFEHSEKGINGFLFAEISFHRKLLQIVDLHLTPLRTWTLRDRLSLPLQLLRLGKTQREELDQALKSIDSNQPTILLGDFNRTGDAAIHRLRNLDYVDSFAEVTPQPDRYPTLSATMLGLRVEKRIDFIFRDHHFRTLSSKIVAGAPSDHHAVASVFSSELY